jgi:tetratricopeptide (TPR) repeat protein
MPDFFPRVDDRAGPARPIAPRRAEEMVRAALGELLFANSDPRHQSQVAPASPTATQTPTLPAPRRKLAALAATGLLLLAGGAAAGVAAWAPWEPRAQPQPTEPVRAIARRSSARSVPSTQPRSVLARAIAEAPGAEPTPAAKPAVRARAAATRTVGSATIRPPAEDPAPERSAGAGAAIDDLERANRLRADRRWAEASDAYARVGLRFPGSDADYVASIARAGLLLDRLGRPALALEGYRRALGLRPSGSLGEEALYGITACHRALGDRTAERSALQHFLATQPSSPLRARVRARLDQIESSR